MDGRFELVTGKQIPWMTWFMLDFVENIYVDLAVERITEGIVESVP